MIKPIGRAFAQAAAQGGAAFVPFLTAGFPDPTTFVEVMAALDRAGADVMEIGFPFSDPLADGPTIQAASRRVLEAGLTVDRALDLTAEVARRVRRPLVIMTYYNPVFRRGLAEFARRAAGSGASGVIIPDLPPEEAGDWLEAAQASGLETIFLVAPTTTPERLERILGLGGGFVYYVSLTGVTGTEISLSDDFKAHLRAIRKLSPRPVAVGFGISTPAQAGALAAEADGVIVGSALIRAIMSGRDGAEQVAAAAELAQALKRSLGRNGSPDQAGPGRAAGAAKEGGS